METRNEVNKTTAAVCLTIDNLSSKSHLLLKVNMGLFMIKQLRWNKSQFTTIKS